MLDPFFNAIKRVVITVGLNFPGNGDYDMNKPAFRAKSAEYFSNRTEYRFC